MSALVPGEPVQGGGSGPGGGTTLTGGNYSLLATEQTVQVLSPTIANDIQYCTIVTHPSGAIVSWPLTLAQFSQNQGQADLAQFAGWVETLLARSEVIAAAGSQSLDASGLLQDNVDFTVEYVAPGSSGTSNTAIASVPVKAGSVAGLVEQVGFLQRAEAAIAAVYARLQNVAGG